VVREGDLIVVPPTSWARFGYVMQAIFFPFQPIFGAAANIGGAYAGSSAIRRGVD